MSSSVAELEALQALEAKQQQLKQQQQQQQEETETEEEPQASESEPEQSENDNANDQNDNDNEQSDNDNEEDDNEDNEDEDDEAGEAVGLGDAMSKILQQSVGADAAPILAKRTTARMREIQSAKSETKTARLSAAERRLKEQKDLVVPDHSTQGKDRQLRAIATKGVVALFNAIEKHQHQSGVKDEKNTKKVKEMSKDNFLGLLKSQKAAVEEKKPAAKSSWAVVQDDFMMGAKLKDWDAAHGTEPGRVRAKDDDDVEDAEAAAWSQVGAAMDSDNDDENAGAAKKRRSASGSAKNAKKSKRS